MKHYDAKKLSLLGLIAGILSSNSSMAAPKTAHEEAIPLVIKENRSNSSSENEGYRLLTEADLLSQLNASSKELYNSLSPEGKTLALQVASQHCDHNNLCRGLNACRTERNQCAGQGECKGQGKCAFGDKNLVIRIVAKKMEEKRNRALNEDR